MGITKRREGKVLTLILSIVLFVSVITGCSISKDAKSKDSKETSSTSKVENKEEENTTEDDLQSDDNATIESSADSSVNQTEQNSIVIPDVTIDSFDIPDNDAMKFVADMKIGWNLGNTFDAFNDDSNIADDSQLESSWCGSKTTKEMIQKVKEAGFNTIRIPVTWHNHLSDKDFTIKKEWLDRVQEVVDYAVDEDMYVILNIHHDVSEKYYYPSKQYLDNSTKYIKSIWHQLSDRFKDYNDKLIFESINEPRLVGSDNEWWLDISKNNCKEAVECINKLNQSFVDMVRGTGGNNKTRYLMVPGYCASADGALVDGFSIPKDLQSNKNKIIVSVHAYTPYNFALQAPLEDGSTATFRASLAESQKDINYFMDGLYKKYISNGIPVVIGEFGARDKNGNLQDRVDYATYYVAAARARGMSCLWWDNNAFAGTGENFGLLDRKTLTITYPDIVSALMKYSVSK